MSLTGNVPPDLTKQGRPLRRMRVSQISLTGDLVRGPLTMAFDWEALASPIGVLVVDVTHLLGHSRQIVPAPAAGVSGPQGKGRITIDLAALPAGSAEIQVTPMDCDGRAGIPGSLTFDVPSCGSPQRLNLRLVPVAGRILKPHGAWDLVFANFRVECEGPGKPSALLVSVRGPDGKEDCLILPPPVGSRPVALFALGSSHQLGSYHVTAHVLEQSGSVGTPAEATVDLVSDQGRSGPAVNAIETCKGNRVSVRGSALNDAGLEVRFASRRVAVTAAFPDELIVESPELDEPVHVSVRTDQGIAYSPGKYVPPVQVSVVPAEFELAQNSEIQFTAIVTGTPDKRVRWRLSGASRRGTLSKSGKLRASLTAQAGPITVEARSLAQPSAACLADGRLVPASAVRGRSLIGSLGGIIRATDGGAQLNVPGRALSRPARLSVRAGSPKARVKGDCIVIAEAAVGGDPCEFKTPALLEVPLHIPLPADSEVAVRVAEGQSRWRVLDLETSVGMGGKTLTIPIHRSPQRLQVMFPWDREIGMPRFTVLPTIRWLAPTRLHEGSTAAVLVSGSNFVPGATRVQLIDQYGQLESRIEIRSLATTADGTRLGIALKVGVMTDLGEGQQHPMRLQVITPAGTAEHTLTIIGHDELDVERGVKTISSSQVFSRMLVNSRTRLNVSNVLPPVQIDCHEVAEIRSTIEEGCGLRVIAGDAARGSAGDIGGRGGAGGSGAGSLNVGGGGAGGSGGVGALSVGTAGSAGSPSVTMTSAGAGGRGGAAGGGGPFPHTGGEGGDGAHGRRSIDVLDIQFEPSPGGGGGGGGGGEGWFIRNTGGGGGGGGAGGGALRIAAGEALHITGDILANGGDGAFGQYPVTVVAPDAPYLIQAGGGGGGGGGAGGCLILQGVSGTSGAVLAVGGIDGTFPGYGNRPVDARTERQRLLARPQTGSIRIDGQVPLTRGSWFAGPDLGYVYSLLATSAQVEVYAPGADLVRVTDGQGREATFPVPSNPASPDRAVVTLFEGFNNVRSELWLGTQRNDPLMSCAPIRERRFLYLAGTIPVHEFSCTVSPSRAPVPTERTVQFSASVVARPATQVVWSVQGGTSDGSVVPNAAGALYRAPSAVPPNPVEVRALSGLDPSRFGSALITVVPGIEVAGIAATGAPAATGVASANVGQEITISIPAAVYAETGQGFALDQEVEFKLIFATPGSRRCRIRRVPYRATSDPGMKSLTIAVPPCAGPDQLIRVIGHGSARLLVVPEITAIALDQNNFPAMFINGSGFTCGATEVIFSTGQVPEAQILSVTCNQVHVAIHPAPGTEIRVRTAGGTSRGFTMP